MAVSNRQFYAIKNTLTKKEKELISFYELQWHLRHNVPTIEEVAGYLKLAQVTINYYLQRRPVIKALEQRGIPFRQHTQDELTATQVATAITIMNFADVRSNEEKLDQLGIASATYYAWLNDPQFKNLIDNLADQNLRNIRPAAIGEFTKLINKGDWQAIKFYLETTGELQNNDAPQSEQLLKMIIEIIQRHVKDPETIIAIAQDIKLAAANRTLEVVTQPQQITGSFEETDPELERAKKMLGV
jgi:succinate dehydrogenase flavin-adding protein (antitoxin of CptAB toxin-antitoxin module)